MNNAIILTIIIVFFFFTSCNTVIKKEETYLYHYKIKEKIMELKNSNTGFKLCMVSDEEKDTIVVNSENIETKLKLFFIDGITPSSAKEYSRIEYEKDKYKVVELSSNNKKDKVKKLLYKENEKGDFYYAMYSSSKNRLATSFTNVSFDSNGNFLIITHQDVPFSYSTKCRVEGKPIAN